MSLCIYCIHWLLIVPKRDFVDFAPHETGEIFPTSKDVGINEMFLLSYKMLLQIDKRGWSSNPLGIESDDLDTKFTWTFFC